MLCLLTLLISEHWVYYDVVNLTQLSLSHTEYQKHCVVSSDSQFWLQVILSFHPELISSLSYSRKKK